MQRPSLNSALAVDAAFLGVVPAPRIILALVSPECSPLLPLCSCTAGWSR